MGAGCTLVLRRWLQHILIRIYPDGTHTTSLLKTEESHDKERERNIISPKCKSQGTTSLGRQQILLAFPGDEILF